MKQELLKKIKEEVDVRQALLALKEEVKSAGEPHLYFTEEEKETIQELLHHEEPKVRKNAAAILGMLKDSTVVSGLLHAFQSEEKLFVREEYLKAMEKLDFKEVLPELKKCLVKLETTNWEEGELKHVMAQKKVLERMVLADTGRQKHTFTGYEEELEVQLVTGKFHREVVAKQVKADRLMNGKIYLNSIGLRFKTSQLGKVLSLRTFKEWMIPLSKEGIHAEPAELGELLATGELLPLLERLHKEKGDFYFRVGVSGKMPLDERSVLAKKISASMEKFSQGRLKNSISHYEIEIRIYETREGAFLPFLKLYTRQDQRFAYRTKTTATAMAPYKAALMAEVTKPYLQEEAQILDPFCGTGTLLIEREMAVHAREIYAIDTYGAAIDCVRENGKNAGVLIHSIHRDFMDFTHNYLFDEIITEMPVRGRKEKEEIAELYEQFFQKAQEHLTEEGIIIMYSEEKGFVMKNLRLHKEYRLIKEIPMDDKDRVSVFVIGRRA